MQSLRNLEIKKKASEAITAPSKLKPKLLALLIACFNASILEVWPHPIPINCLSLTNTIAFDFVCLHIVFANNKSLSCFFVGLILVILSKFLLSIITSRSTS